MKTYKAPNVEMRKFLASSLRGLSGFERLENQQLSKLLIERHEGKCEFHANEIGNTFSWLHKIGVLDFDKKYLPSGGWRLLIYRCCDPASITTRILKSDDVTVESGTVKPKPAEKPDSSCCDNPHVVKSKKSGKQRCKNCKTSYSGKEPAASAPKSEPEPKACCDDPHPVKSKKTGKRRCKNCNAPLSKRKK